MAEENKTLWERVSQRQPTIWMGQSAVLHTPSDFQVLRLNCAVPWTAQGPLRRVYQQIRSLLGEEMDAEPNVEGHSGLRYQLLGEMPLNLLEQGVVVACNRLVEATEGKAVLLIDAVEQADPSALTALSHLLGQPDELKIPWVMTLEHEPKGELKTLVDELNGKWENLLFSEDTNDAPKEEAKAFPWHTLPARSLRVLRAGSVIGSMFEAELVGRMLSLEHLEVLEALQEAADLGAPLGDIGDSRFFLPSQSIQELHHRMLPSLLTYLHERLARELAGKSPKQPVETPLSQLQLDPPTHFDPDQPEIAEPDEPPSPHAAATKVAEELPPAPPPGTQSELGLPEISDELLKRVAPETYATFFEGQSALKDEPPEEEPQDDLSTLEFEPSDLQALEGIKDAQTSAWRDLPRREEVTRDKARAAVHLYRAGHTKEALLHFLDAAQDASAVGDTRQGIYLTQQAIRLLEHLPRSFQRSVLEASTLLEMARLQWNGSVAGATFPLQEALASIKAAKSRLPVSAPLDLLGKIAAVYAGISYDLGDFESLEDGLRELSTVSRQLLAGNAPLEAAELLNDQAALYIRLGDPQRGSRLLYQSRELFEKLEQEQPDDPTTLRELAETEHLLARLPLHAPVRAGREVEAYTRAIEHTHTADKLYARLGKIREQARVWVTKGVLEIGSEQDAQAARSLTKAINTQKAIGDFTGLAYSTAALSRLFAKQKQHLQALQMLQESIIFNMEKGAPIGIAFNRRAYHAFLERLDADGQDLTPSPRIHDLLAQTQQLLQHAESLLGRVPLPKNEREGILHSVI